MKKNFKIIITILLMLVLIVGCTNEEKEIDKLKDKLTKVAEKVFINDEWTKGGVREDTYTLALKELAEHNQLKLEDYKDCDAEKSNIQFIVNRQTEPNKTNYELKVNLICE